MKTKYLCKRTFYSMALQQINWAQIDTQNVPSGSSITLGASSGPLAGAHFDELYIGGENIATVIDSGLDGLYEYTSSIKESLEFTGSNLTVKGDLNVIGTVTSIKSEKVVIDDNIIELNGSEGSFGGLMIKDPNQPNLISGSLLWDTTNDRWIAGPAGSELPMARWDDLVWGNSGSHWGATTNLEVTGSVVIRGDLKVEGQTTLQSQDINQDSLIVSGAMSIIKNELENQLRSATLSIENLGKFGDRGTNSIIDLGEFF